MDSKIKIYVRTVIDSITAEESMKKRIESDLYSHLNAACEYELVDAVLERMGSPELVAKDFMDNIYESKNDVIEKLVQERTKMNQMLKGYFEYKSNFEILGLPLVHIKMRKYDKVPGVAKGIIAIGDIAYGAVALGGLSFGGITLGGLSLGLLSFGGVSAGLLAALGGFAAGGLFAAGGMAVSLGGAIGGFALGEIAMGGIAKGTVAIGGKAIGEYALETNGNMVPKEDIINLIKNAYPQLSDWIIRIFAIFGS